jgi:hypothetical protein
MTLVRCSPGLMGGGGGTMNSQVFLNGKNGSKRFARIEDKAHHFLRYQRHCSL